jgi:hypothetical protein
MVATSDSPSKTKSRITFSHKHCRWRCSRSRVDLKIVKPSATMGSASVLGHTYGSVTISMPLFQRGSGSRDPPELLLLHFSKCWWQTIYDSASLSIRQVGGATRNGKEEGLKVCGEDEHGHLYMGEGASAPIGCLDLSPLHGGVNLPLHGMVTSSHS